MRELIAGYLLMEDSYRLRYASRTMGDLFFSEGVLAYEIPCP